MRGASAPRGDGAIICAHPGEPLWEPGEGQSTPEPQRRVGERDHPMPSSRSRELSRAAHRFDPALMPAGWIVNGKDGSILVPVPAGPAIFGSPKGSGHSDEHPQFRANLPAYYIGLHPVTNAQYKRFVDETGHRPPDHADWRNAKWSGRSYPASLADHPVVCVSWDDAKAYCDWAGLRLPSELEWEKAARGTDGRVYPWGNRWEETRCRNYANRYYHNSGNAETASVASFAAGRSPYGILNMVGNVWEWCADWYDANAYARYARGDLTPPTSGSFRVLRGGSWFNYANDCRSAYRDFNLPGYRLNFLGFRVARAP